MSQVGAGKKRNRLFGFESHDRDRHIRDCCFVEWRGEREVIIKIDPEIFAWVNGIYTWWWHYTINNTEGGWVLRKITRLILDLLLEVNYSII